MSAIFLDNNATTQPLPEVIEEVTRTLAESWGNPGSNHTSGEQARSLLADSRAFVAELSGTIPERVHFTSGGTEANNLAIRAMLGLGRGSQILTSSVEHASIRSARTLVEHSGFSLVELPVDRSGLIDLPCLSDALAQGEVAGVSIQWVNNETGVIQPIAEISQLCRQHSIPLHTDACQALGKIDFAAHSHLFDFITITAHKLHGPKGAGAIIAPPRLLTPIFYGGDQEVGVRPGTENLPGIAGFGRACQIRQDSFQQHTQHLASLRDRFESGILAGIPGTKINGAEAHRVSNTSNVRFPGIDAVPLTLRLDLAGIECSQTSACTSARPEPSHVLTAMGLTEDDAYASIRFGFSVLNTATQVDTAVEIIKDEFQRLHRLSQTLVH